MPKLLKKQSLKTRSPAQRASLQRLNEGTQNKENISPTKPQPTRKSGINWKNRAQKYNANARALGQKLVRAKERLLKHQNELQDIK